MAPMYRLSGGGRKTEKWKGKEADFPDHQPWPAILQKTGTETFQAGAE